MSKIGNYLAVGILTVGGFVSGIMYQKKKVYDKNMKRDFLSCSQAMLDDIFINLDKMERYMQPALFAKVEQHVNDFRLGEELRFDCMDAVNSNKFHATSANSGFRYEFTWDDNMGSFDCIISPLPGVHKRWLDYLVNCYLS